MSRIVVGSNGVSRWVAQFILLGVILALGLLTTSVRANDTDSKYAATQLFEASGLDAVIAKLPESASASFEDTLTVERLPEQFRHVEPERIAHAIRTSFTTTTFNRYLIAEIDRKVSADSTDELLRWFRTALGNRLMRAEIENSLLTNIERFEVFQEALVNSGVDDEREALVHRLDKTMQASESAVDTMANVQMAFNLSLAPFLPEQQRFSRADMESYANQNHARLMVEYRNQTREVLLFTYQEFTNEELAIFNETLASVAGQQFISAINEGVKKAMFSASLSLGDRLGELVGNDLLGPGI